MLEGPLILVGYGKYFLDFSITLRINSERFSSKLLIIEVQKVMGSR